MPHVALKQQPLRVLTNPEIKLPIPADFPSVVYTHARDEVLQIEVLDGLRRFGINKIEDAGVINIAYCHKHPVLHPGHENRAFDYAKNLERILRDAAPEGAFRLAHEICETVKLGRMFNQGAVHALIGRQEYALHLPEGEAVPDYLDPQKKDALRGRFFIIVDDTFEQGTTLTSLMSYIHHNGGHVLFAAVNRCIRTSDLQQFPSDNKGGLSGIFSDASRNTGRLEDMAQHFADDERFAGRKTSPQACMEAFEQALNACGNTVFALTEIECERVMQMPYGDLMKSLTRAAPRKAKQPCPA